MPTHVIVELESTSMQSRFVDVREIIWYTDGATIRMKGLAREWSASQVGGVIERVSARLPVESFLVLARGRKLIARPAGVEVALSTKDRAALRHFAAKIAAAAP